MNLLVALRDGLADRYEVVAEVGRGGMAIVVRGQDRRSGEAVAIKALYPELARAVSGRRFLREIELLRALDHPGIVQLREADTLELVPGLDLPWYAMPYLGGTTLRTRLRAAPLSLEEACGYGRDLCAALGYAHGMGILHRDLKPENILLHEGRAVLADFGIARAVLTAGGDRLSSTGVVVGTPAYMSPEQAAGAPDLGPGSDLYALGLVLYEMLAGEPAFTGRDAQAVLAKHLRSEPPSVRVLRPEVPEAIAVALLRLLHKDPADRPDVVSVDGVLGFA